MQTETYFVTRRNSTGTQRKAWRSAETGTLFCGMCLRGEVAPQHGATCAECGSEVVSQFAMISGGVRRSGSAAIRAERRKRESAKASAAARDGKVLFMRAS